VVTFRRILNLMCDLRTISGAICGGFAPLLRTFYCELMPIRGGAEDNWGNRECCGGVPMFPNSTSSMREPRVIPRKWAATMGMDAPASVWDDVVSGCCTFMQLPGVHSGLVWLFRPRC
jgi:hypothetical protein